MESNVHLPKVKGGWQLVLASALSALAAVIFPFALLIVPALWAYTMLRTKPAFLGLFGALSLFAQLALFPPLPAISLALLGIVSALALYLLQTKRQPCLYAAAAVALVSVACLYCAICLPGVLSGEGAFAAVQAVADEAIATYRAMAADTLATLPAETAALFSDSLDSISASISSAVVPALCSFGAALGLSNLLFFRLFARKKELGLAPMRPLRFWALPKSWTPGILLLLVGSLVLEWIGLDYAAGVTATVNVAVSAPLMVQGLAYTDFLICRKGGSVTGRRVLVYILLGVFFLFTQSLLMMLGCLEQLFRFRERGFPFSPPSKNP